MIEKAGQMVKLVEVIPRRPDLSHAQFLRHLSTTHLAAVDRVPEFRDRVRRYMQNHLFTEQAQLERFVGCPVTAGGDAIVEVWWDTIADILDAFNEPRYMEIIRPDELSFGDVAGAWGVMTTDTVVMSRAGFDGLIKCFVFLKKADDLARPQFLSRWEAVRDRRFTQTSAFGKLVGRFVENRADPDLGEKLPGMKAFDLVLELWFDSLDRAAQFMADPDALAFHTDDTGGFLDWAATLLYVAQEQPATAEWLRTSGDRQYVR